MLNVWGLQIQGYTFAFPASIGHLWAYMSTKEDVYQHLQLTGIGARFNDTVMELLDEVDAKGPPDIILVSMYLWNRTRSNKLTKAIKKKYPNVIMICGGPEPPQNPHRLKQFAKENPQYDYYVFGEGEIALEAILRKILSEKGIYDSEYFDDCFVETKNGSIIRKPERRRYLPHKTDLDLPSPYLMGLFDSLSEKYHDIHTMGILETNRGCPYACTYCDWGLEEKLRKNSMDRIEKEFEWMSNKVDEIYVTDANFGILERDVDIAKYFVKSKIRNPNPRFKSIIFSYAKNSKKRVVKIAEILEKFDISRSGATFALQTLNPDTLNAIRRDNMKISTDYKWIAEQFVDKGIPYSSEMILGLPLETKESFFDGLNELLELNPFLMNTYKLEYLENSELGRDNHSERYGMEWATFEQNPSNHDDERELVKIIQSTNTMPLEDMRYVRKIRDLIEIFWMGRTSYFVGRYLQKNHQIKTCDFIQAMDSWFTKNDPEFWSTLLASKEDLRGKGKESVPLWYDYNKVKYQRFVNAWIYINGNLERKNSYFKNLLAFVLETYPDIDAELAEDLVNFNKNILIEPSVEKDKKVSTKYNWVQYFIDYSLKRATTDYVFNLTFAGSAKEDINDDKESVFYYVAGGHPFLFNKQNAFIYNYGTLHDDQGTKLDFLGKLGRFYDSNEYDESSLDLLKEIVNEDSEDISVEYAFYKIFNRKLNPNKECS